MNNLEIAQILEEIAILLDIQDIAFKPQAYLKVAKYLETMGDDIAHIYHQGGEKALENIPGIGSHIAEKIIELIETDNLKYLEKLRKQIPVDVIGLSKIEGVGPKTIKKMYKSFGAKTVDDLYKIAKQGKIKTLEGFKEKTEENIIKNIEFLKSKKGKFTYDEAIASGEGIIEFIKKFKCLKKIEVCGSLRRKKDEIKDIDLLACTSNQKKFSDHFCSFNKIISISGKGLTKISVKLENGINVDLRIVPEKSWGSALQYFTGNKDHNINLRKIAINKGLKLNEYGLYKGNKQIGGKTEEEVYNILGFKYIPPEERVNKGEFEKYEKK